jgi:hypothetical protein
MLSNFKKIITRDDNPKKTKFLTYFLMPPMIVLFYWGTADSIQKINKLYADNNTRFGIVTEINKYDYSSRKRKEYSLLFRLNTETEEYNVSSIHFDSNDLLSKLHLGDTCNLKFTDDRGVHKVCQLSVNGKVVLTQEQYVSNLLNVKYITFLFGTLFLFWFCSRIYRYRRYGSLTKNIA